MDPPPKDPPEKVIPLFEEAGKLMQDLLRENKRLRHHVGDVEKENTEFAERFVAVEAHNELLQNLFISSHQLHATLEPAKVVGAIKEILLNLVGAERFGIWIFDEGSVETQALLDHEGLGDGPYELGARALELAEAGDEEAWYAETETASDSDDPLAIVPLRLDGRLVGLIAIHTLLDHKKGINDLDRQILTLLSKEAATALQAARMYAEKVRKLDSMQSFLDFIKEQG